MIKIENWRSRIAAIATVLKTVIPYGIREFESHLLRLRSPKRRAAADTVRMARREGENKKSSGTLSGPAIF